MLLWSPMTKKEEKQKTLIISNWINSWITGTSLRSFEGLLQLLGINGPHYLKLISPNSLQALLPIMGAGVVHKSRQVDFKLVFTSLHIPFVLLLMYMPISEIPRIVWYTKYQSWLSPLRNPLCMILAWSKNSEMWSVLLTFPLDTQENTNQRKHLKVHELSPFSSAFSASDWWEGTILPATMGIRRERSGNQ